MTSSLPDITKLRGTVRRALLLSGSAYGQARMAFPVLPVRALTGNRGFYMILPLSGNPYLLVNYMKAAAIFQQIWTCSVKYEIPFEDLV